MSTLEFYLIRAEQCGREAEASTLVNVRDRHLTAQAVWLDMADRLERTNIGRAEVAASKAEAAEASILTSG
jgi:ribosomal protein L18E